MRSLLFFTVFFLSIAGCKDTGAEKRVEEIRPGNEITNADIIRNPVSMQKSADTINVARFSFTQTTYDFGKVNEGDMVEHTFYFTNTGKIPLLINNAKSTCGCTVPEWPKHPIPPGEKGEIYVKFNTKNKKNQQRKPVTITANTYPAETKVFVEGFVIPDNNPQDENN